MVLFFCSYEMQPKRNHGAAAGGSRVNSQDISYRTLTDAQYQRLSEYYGMAGNLPIRYGINVPRPKKQSPAEAKDEQGRELIDMRGPTTNVKRAQGRVPAGRGRADIKGAQAIVDRVECAGAGAEPTQPRQRGHGIKSAYHVRNARERRHRAGRGCDRVDVPIAWTRTTRLCRHAKITSTRAVRILLDKNRQGKSGVAIDTAFDGATMTFISKSAVLEAGTMKCAECGQNITNETMYGLTGWTCDNCVIEGSEGRYNGFHSGLRSVDVDDDGQGWVTR